MLGYVGVYFVKFIILYQGKKERPAKTKFMSAKAKLRAVLVNFGFPRKKRKKRKHVGPSFSEIFDLKKFYSTQC